MSHLYEHSVPQLTKMLSNLDRWLESAQEYAKKKNFEADVLVTARLAPDMYPLARQVQSACDSAKFCAARLSGQEAPKHPDTETTMEQLRARVKAVVAYLGTVKKESFAGADTRKVKLTFMEGKGLLGGDYLTEMALPNLYFHLTTVYAILRHNGIDVGKAAVHRDAEHHRRVKVHAPPSSLAGRGARGEESRGAPRSPAPPQFRANPPRSKLRPPGDPLGARRPRPAAPGLRPGRPRLPPWNPRRLGRSARGPREGSRKKSEPPGDWG